jgi:ketosteroid isomerase-like protein
MSDKKSLLATFEKFKAALFANDVAALEGMMTEDYIGYDPQGNSQDLKMCLEAYQPGCAKLDKFDVEEIDARVIGEVGIITGKGHIHGAFAGCEFEHHLRFMDLYVLRAGYWRLQLTQVTPLAAQ